MNETGGAAFPGAEYNHQFDKSFPYDGMTLRDYFAAKAMQGIIAGTNVDITPKMIADLSYAVADAMLKEREK